VLDALVSGRMQMWLDPEKITDMVTVTAITTYPAMRVVSILLVGGHGIRSWQKELVRVLSEFGQANGCIALETAVRPGLAGAVFRERHAVLKGWDKLFSVIRWPIKHGDLSQPYLKPKEPDLTAPPPANPPIDAPANAALAASVSELSRCGRDDLAVRLAAIIADENDGSADAHSLLANCLDRLGQWPQALLQWQRAAQLAPKSPVARFNLAIALMRLGDYGSGLPLYEARIDKPDWTGFSALPSRTAARRRLLKPGEPMAGRTILVLAEQGLGDCILFTRYVPLLAQGGARVILACSPPLRPVFAHIPGITELLSPPPAEPDAKLNLSALSYDAWVPLMSLPLHVGGAPPIVPQASYLRADELRCSYWRDRYTEAGGAEAIKIGLVYQANPAGRAAVEKSLRADDLAPLVALPGFDWIVLQQGEVAAELTKRYPAVIDPNLSRADLDDFAAAVAATDLLVSVDTMAAHLAGAIGHPAFVAIPFNPHWYWGIGSDTTPWYPTLSLFRQEAPHGWASTIRRMAEALRARFHPPNAVANDSPRHV